MRSARSHLGPAVALAAVAGALSACSAILGLQDRVADVDGGPDVHPADGASAGMDSSAGPDGGGGSPDATNPFDATEGLDGTSGQDSASATDGQPGNPDTGVGPITGTCPQPACTMATALNHPFQMASDGDRVYWTEYGTQQGSTDGKLRVCPLGGCPDAGPIDYATSQANPQGIALDSQNVYWGTAGGLYWCPLAGCPAGSTGEVLTAAQAPFGITTAGGYVYWVEQGTTSNATVHRMAGPGQTNNVLYDGGTDVLFQPGGIAVDSQYVYVTDDFADVFRLPITGGEPTQVVTGTRGGVWPVTLDTSYVYFGQIDEIGRMPKAGPTGGSAIYSNVIDPDGFFLDTASGFLYWSDYGSGNGNDGTVGKLPTDGGAAVVLKISQATTEAVTVSGPYVYWMSNGTLDVTTGGGMANSGALYRAPK